MLREGRGEVLPQVKGKGEDAKEFAMRVGIHQESDLVPFLFAVVMDVVTGGGK